MRKSVTINAKTGEVTEHELPPLPVTAGEVKREANRRIISIVPDWKQRNLLARAVMLPQKGKSNWTQEEMDAWESGEAIWRTVDAIRAASDKIEAMDPIPQDYRDDKYWTTA